MYGKRAGYTSQKNTMDKGTLCLAGNEEIQSLYLVELLENYEHTNIKNPLCKILRVVSYPNQTAIMDETIVHEHSPLAENAIERLDVDYTIVSEECSQALLSTSYNTSLQNALLQCIDRYKDKYDANIEILKILQQKLEKMKE